MQIALDKDPNSYELREEESILLNAYNEARLNKELFQKQRAKISWLREGDGNTGFFHKMIKGSNNRNKIALVVDNSGMHHEGDWVAGVFLDHYREFLGKAENVNPIRDTNSLFTKRLSNAMANDMIREIQDREIKAAMFEISEESAFFKSSWEIVGPDICLAVKEFFVNGKLLKELNNTIITLIPKVTTPLKVTDYWPLSCCNVLHKCISRIITTPMKNGLIDIVSNNQLACVPGRKIADNILLSQELVRNYHLPHGTPRCAFKIDIQKAYDTVNWVFLRHILVGVRFHEIMIRWIMACVTSTSYSICVNGMLHGYFPGKRSLRQGGLMSPYLFTLVMEVLTLILKRWEL